MVLFSTTSMTIIWFLMVVNVLTPLTVNGVNTLDIYEIQYASG